ncbi:hypothetical protein HR060_09520 [Catenovulum sp. SM1970]|uniref:hypothetical protein n=1 Tax=Marinifaba aquimaris TaxID=2741323 RepID=UPI001573E53B|nr:hypothetical protein [Marinifaba aquimaris]NTS77111.1 hypothetical protein [Marinifaba aquimaris]
MYEPWINGIIKKWSLDKPEEELYELMVHKEKTVTVAYGRFAHSSGSKAVSWAEFSAGELDDLVAKTMGKDILNQAHKYIREQGI